MKIIFQIFVTFVVVFYGLAVSAQPSDECSVELDQLASPFENLGPIKELQSPKIDRDKHGLSHILELPSGVQVTYWTGGCVHYGFTYDFGHLNAMPHQHDPALFDVLRAQVATLPIKKDDLDFLLSMIKALEQASHRPENWQTSGQLYSDLGDANLFLSLKKDGFALAYDFPL